MKLVLCVFACATIPKYQAEILKIHETWYQRALERGVQVFFFLGEEPTHLQGPEFIYLPGVANDYLSASYKQYLGIQYIHQRISYDFIHICGTDTFINVDNLLALLETLPNPQMYNYAVGGHGCERQLDPTHPDTTPKVRFLSGGPGFSLSHQCVSLIYPYLGQMMEMWCAKCDVHPLELDPLRTACDVALCFYLQTLTKTILVEIDTHFFHCNYLGFPCHPGQVPCETLAACHCMSLVDFDTYEQFLKLKRQEP